MKTLKIGTPILVLILAFAFATPLLPFAQAGPLVCSIYQNDQVTSSDSSMYSQAVGVTCPNGNTYGENAWEVYSGSYSGYATTSAVVCGSVVVVSSNTNQADYSFTDQYGCSGSVSLNNALNTQGGQQFGQVSGASTTVTWGWSGNCPWSNSNCEAVATASAT